MKPIFMILTEYVRLYDSSDFFEHAPDIYYRFVLPFFLCTCTIGSNTLDNMCNAIMCIYGQSSFRCAPAFISSNASSNHKRDEEFSRPCLGFSVVSWKGFCKCIQQVSNSKKGCNFYQGEQSLKTFKKYDLLFILSPSVKLP